MNLIPTRPRRPLEWPPLVERIAQAAPDSSRLYLVGGVVRDALLGSPTHDIDLASPDDGLKLARTLADALGGAYYAVDPKRHTGRVILDEGEKQTIIDVASFRDGDLLGDLTGRDFTINAMAVRLDHLPAIIDPLGGQTDLFETKILRQCSDISITYDPIRALRAVRFSLQFRLRMEPSTSESARSAAVQVIDASGNLTQAERVRDELFKMLAGVRPAAALRLLHSLGLLAAIWPGALPPDGVIIERLTVVERVHNLLTIISPQRNDHTAADLVLGVAVMVLDRHRRQLREHLWRELANERTRAQVLLLGSMIPPTESSGELWADRLRLSNQEKRLLGDLQKSHGVAYLPTGWVDNRQVYRYYGLLGESGIDAVILALAEYLSIHNPPDPDTWGRLLDEVASPLLDAFFRRHQDLVAPPPLLTGNDLMQHLDLQPGLFIGSILSSLAEEQAAGTIRTKKEALHWAKRLADANKTS